MHTFVISRSRWQLHFTRQSAPLLLLLQWLLVPLWLLSVTVQAADTLSFRVVDEQGIPLADAVVEILTTAGDVSAEGVRNMDQVEVQFSPRVLVINKGQQVAFPNSDNIRHHVYSFSAAKAFEIKLYAAHPGAPLAFDTPGVVVLGCNIHDNMIGYIYVARSASVGKTDQAGLLTTAYPAQLKHITVWHPLFTATGQPPIELMLDQLVADSSDAASGRYLITLPVVAEAEGQTSDLNSNDGDKFLNFELP
jgi:plastocyanin